MNYRARSISFSISVSTLALVGVVACGGGGKTSESAGESSSAAQTTGTSAGSTGPETTAVTGSGSTAGTGSASESNSSVATVDPTTGATGSSGTSSTGTGSTSGTTSTGTTDGSSGGSTGSTGTTGDVCVDQAGSCAKGEACCAGLECCAGVPVPPGKEFCGVECPKSDRNVKRAFLPVDAAEVLRRVVALEITTWEYKKDPADLRHLGPMAQDFKQAFGLGHDDKTIFPLDASGVAMAAIQALHAENEALRDRLAQLELRLAKQGR